MSTAVTKIKSRIKSVDSAYKVTSAMKLVSTVKLKQWKNKMLALKDYNIEIEDTLLTLLKHAKKQNCPFLKINENPKKLYVIISSTLGLCGSYNSNIFKLADVTLKKDDDIIVLGNKGIIHYQDFDVNKISGFESYNSIADKKLIKEMSHYILDAYQNNKYGEIHIIHSEYKNSLVFLAKDFILLPLKNEGEETLAYSPIMEPNAETLINKIAPFYLNSMIYSKMLESMVCEQGARSNAMENATNNAKELLDELNIEFNKARQTSITQEITEIVSASKAL